MRIELLKSLVVMIVILTIQSGCTSKPVIRDVVTSCRNGTKPTVLGQEFNFPGTLLFSVRGQNEILALDGETHKVLSLVEKNTLLNSYQISPLSPDGNWLVLSQLQALSENRLLLQKISNEGSIQTGSLSVEGLILDQTGLLSWNQLDWINNSYLLGYAYKNPEERGVITLLNPFQMEWKELTKRFEVPNPAIESGYSISPDLSRLLYVNNQFQLILYDLVNNKNLWQYKEYDGINPDMNSVSLRGAVWSDDGNLLATPISRNQGNIPGILILDKEGKLVNIAYIGARPFGLSWSHDRQFVSFYENRCTTLNCEGQLRPTIRLYRIEDGLINDLCSLSVDTDPGGYIQSQRIVWSPDDKYIGYGFGNDSSMNHGIILQKLDDDEVRLFKIENKDLILLGWSKYKWMKSLPGKQ